ncbi:MAG: MFS transporter [Pirellulales bacterium]|nr:MFS transporter [Pirellulales bacterium]
MTHSFSQPELNPGTARLAVIVPVTILSFFYINALEYSLPLYFEARSEAALGAGHTFPQDVWAQLVKYKITAWLIGPLAAGLLSRRYGERFVWGTALAGKVAIPLTLTMHPEASVIAPLAFWQGLTGAIMWTAGASMFQMVAPGKKGFANAWMMVSLALGSLLAPFAARGFIHRSELMGFVEESDWHEFWTRFFNLTEMSNAPQLANFRTLFFFLLGTTLFCGVMILLWSQRPGQFEHGKPAGWQQTLRDLETLMKTPGYWALVIALCIVGGPVFQASNQFLPYRAEQLGLIGIGGADQGWIWLGLLKVFMWLPGGIAVGWLAGRGSSGLAGVVMLGGFSLAALSIGFTQFAWQLFACVAVYEFVRQFMRWSHTGYLAENVPPPLRSTAIGFAITCAGVGSTLYAWIAPEIWDPNSAGFDSAGPFWAAGVLGVLTALGLFTYHRFRPIRAVSSAQKVEVNPSDLSTLCETLLADNPKVVADVQNGKLKAIGALIGQAKQKNPNVTPDQVRETCLQMILNQG